MRLCSVEQCDRKHFAKNYCDFHYRRLRRYGTHEYLGEKRPQGLTLVRNELGEKQCSKCDRWLPEDMYYSGNHTKDGLSPKCKDCSAEMRRVKFYNVPTGWYLTKLEEQGSRCAICLEPLSPDLGNIDHDHACCEDNRSCGECVRGILCRGCNMMLGAVDDDPARLFAAIRYLEKYS